MTNIARLGMSTAPVKPPTTDIDEAKDADPGRFPYCVSRSNGATGRTQDFVLKAQESAAKWRGVSCEYSQPKEEQCLARSELRTRRQMTDVERSVYFPAVQEADAKLDISLNSVPNQRWASRLRETQETLRQYLVLIERERT